MTTTEATDALAARGWTIETSLPRADVRDDWPCISYNCKLSLKGKTIWEGPFHLGVGHAKLPKEFPPGLPLDLRPVFITLQRNPNAVLRDKKERAKLAAFFALRQKVKPDLASVLHSLFSDASGSDDTFEDWASNCGSNPDSIKAKGIWEACQEIARTLRRCLTAEEREACEAILQDF